MRGFVDWTTCGTAQSCDLSLQVYVLGTILSMQISFVGFQPVQSSEHMAVSPSLALCHGRHLS